LGRVPSSSDYSVNTNSLYVSEGVDFGLLGVNKRKRQMNYMTGEYKGELCVIGEWQTGWDKPELFRHYWPTGLRAMDWPNLMDKPARSFGSHVYEVKTDSGASRYVSLIHEGETKAIFVETKPVKKSKWAVSWQNGEWKRY